jgi:hypothetical protein
MSQDVARSAVAAFNPRDLSALEAMFADDFVLRISGGLADITRPEFRGRRAAMGWIRDLVETIGGLDSYYSADEAVAAVGLEA